MKKFTKMMACLFAFLSLGLASCSKAPFKVGKDTATYEAEGHSAWAGTVNAYVCITAGDTELFNGTVTVTSDNVWAYEFIEAACDAKELNIEGASAGFITQVGSYINNNDTFTYWGWVYNGHENTSFGVDQVHIFEGDYILLSYSVMSW